MIKKLFALFLLLSPSAAFASQVVPGQSLITIRDEGTYKGKVSSMNFTGSGVSASVNGGTATINITGGGGGTGGSSVEVFDQDGTDMGPISTMTAVTGSQLYMYVDGTSVAFKVDLSTLNTRANNLDSSTASLKTMVATNVAVLQSQIFVIKSSNVASILADQISKGDFNFSTGTIDLVRIASANVAQFTSSGTSNLQLVISTSLAVPVFISRQNTEGRWVTFDGGGNEYGAINLKSSGVEFSSGASATNFYFIGQAVGVGQYNPIAQLHVSSGNGGGNGPIVLVSTGASDSIVSLFQVTPTSATFGVPLFLTGFGNSCTKLYTDASGQVICGTDQTGGAGGSADNLGTHIATQPLNMNNFPLDKVSSMSITDLKMYNPWNTASYMQIVQASTDGISFSGRSGILTTNSSYFLSLSSSINPQYVWDSGSFTAINTIQTTNSVVAGMLVAPQITNLAASTGALSTQIATNAAVLQSQIFNIVSTNSAQFTTIAQSTAALSTQISTNAAVLQSQVFNIVSSNSVQFTEIITSTRILQSQHNVIVSSNSPQFAEIITSTRVLQSQHNVIVSSNSPQFSEVITSTRVLQSQIFNIVSSNVVGGLGGSQPDGNLAVQTATKAVFMGGFPINNISSITAQSGATGVEISSLTVEGTITSTSSIISLGNASVFNQVKISSLNLTGAVFSSNTATFANLQANVTDFFTGCRIVQTSHSSHTYIASFSTNSYFGNWVVDARDSSGTWVIVECAMPEDATALADPVMPYVISESTGVDQGPHGWGFAISTPSMGGNNNLSLKFGSTNYVICSSVTAGVYSQYKVSSTDQAMTGWASAINLAASARTIYIKIFATPVGVLGGQKWLRVFPFYNGRRS